MHLIKPAPTYPLNYQGHLPVTTIIKACWQKSYMTIPKVEESHSDEKIKIV